MVTSRRSSKSSQSSPSLVPSRPCPKDRDLQPKEAFLKAIEEYNSYEVAAFAKRFQIDSSTAIFMYGFSATCLINQLVRTIDWFLSPYDL